MIFLYNPYTEKKLTAYGTTETAIEATKLGAFDYVLKPFEIHDMLDVIAKAIETGRFMRSKVEMNATPEKASQEAIIGRSVPMQDLYKMIGRTSASDATVLIRGETGTGKELVPLSINTVRGQTSLFQSSTV